MIGRSGKALYRHTRIEGLTAAVHKSARNGRRGGGSAKRLLPRAAAGTQILCVELLTSVILQGGANIRLEFDLGRLNCA